MIGALVDWFTDPAHWSGPAGVPTRVVEHLTYSGITLLVAAAVGIAAGLWVGHTGRGRVAVAGLANALRALPTLGLLILAVLLLAPALAGSAAFVVPALLALVVLAIPPVLTATYAGIAGVDPAARDAAAGLGMTSWQVLWRVEVPCATPLIFSGLRSATLQLVSTATVASYVSLGGLGRYLLDGQAVRDYPQMLAGALLVAALALILDAVFALAQRVAVPRGLSGRVNRYGRSNSRRRRLHLLRRHRPSPDPASPLPASALIA
jgi:osmoprotectant transport system permease protein